MKAGVTYLLNRLFVPLAAVCGESIAIKVSTRNLVSDCLHLCEQCAVKAVVIPVCEEEVVTRERRICLKLVVAIKTGLGAQNRKRRSTRCSIATDTQATREYVTTSLDTKDCEKDS